MKRNLLLLFAVLLTALTASAQIYFPFEYNGINYVQIGENQVQVVGSGSGQPYQGDIVIPNMVFNDDHTYYVTKIGSSAFANCTNLTSVRFSSISTIGSYAFMGCTSLTSFTIPDNVTTLEWNVFQDCSSLTNVVIGTGVTSIRENAFYGCTALTSIYCKAATPPTIQSNTFDGYHYSLAKLYVPVGKKIDYQTANYWSTFTNIYESDYDFEKDGLYYTITSSSPLTVKLTYRDTGYNCYSGNVTIPSTVTIAGSYYYNLTYNVTEIGDNTFRDCTDLTQVTIPSSVTVINSNAFRGCTNLSSVTIPSWVYTIGTSAFSGCYGLRSVDIPNSVMTIGQSAFNYCINLESVTIGSGVTSIGNSAFGSCVDLTRITCKAATPPTIQSGTFTSKQYSNAKLVVPVGKTSTYRAANYWSDFTNIVESDYDFEDNGIYYKITGTSPATVKVTYSDTEYNSYRGDVTIPSTVTSGGTTYHITEIGANAFRNCTGLTQVKIPTSVTTIEASAFRDCSSLTSVVIPNSVTTIGQTAFYNCSQLSSVVIGSDVTSIGTGAFNYCAALTSITCWAATPPNVTSNTFGGNQYSNAQLYVPVGQKSAYQSANNWSNFTNIHELAVHFVVNGIFYRITSTSTSEVEVSYRNEDYNSYSGRVTIPSTVTYDCTTYNVTSIGERAFKDCSGLTSVTIPSSVIDLSALAFSACTGLTTVTIPSSVTRLLDGVFESCTGLTSVTIPSSVTFIGAATFKDCTGLTSVTIPSSVTTLAVGAFMGCTGLTSVTVPSSVTEMGAAPFAGCDGLTTLKVASGNPVYSSPNNCNAIIRTSDLALINGCKTTVIPNNVTSIETAAFWGLPSLTSIEIPSSVAAIDEYAFKKCTGLTSVTLPSSLISIHDEAFAECTGLTSVTCLAQTPPAFTNVDAFDNATYANATLNVPSSSMSAYQAANGWSLFAHIMASREAYACYTTANNGTLTFYYDTQRGSRTGTTYDLNTGDDVPGWYSLHEDIHHVIFDPSFADARPTSTYFWFYGFEEPEFIGWNYLNTSEVTNMSGMFGFLQYLESIDVSHFDTSKVTDMSEMFEYTALTSLDLRSFNTSNVTDMRLMFCESQSLQTIYVGPGWTTAAVTSSAEMFSNCTSLVGGHGTTYDANHVDKAYAHLDGGPSNPGYFTDPYVGAEAYACYMPSNTTLTFYYDTDRSIRTGTTYDLNTGNDNPGWYTDNTYLNVTKVVFNPSFVAARPTSTRMWFYGMKKLTTITGIENLNTSDVANMGHMFYGCSGLTSLDVSHFTTSNVANMGHMFYNCTGLTSLDVSGFNTLNVTSMSNMFYKCSGLTSLDVSGFNTSNVTSMPYMFSACYGLTSLDVSGFNTSKVTSMSNMFSGCIGLTSLDVSSFNTSNVTSMWRMFYSCTGLTNLDVSGFNTTNVTDMGGMFTGCKGLTSLDLSSFNSANVTSMSTMFYGDTNLTTIYVGSGWTTDAVSSSSQMFYDCTSLEGGMGTTYEEYYPQDKTYAHIDGGPDNPGYFTDINNTPEAYACYKGGVLTFYYDSHRSVRQGTTYDLNEGNEEPGWIQEDAIGWSADYVFFDPSFADARPTSTYKWFDNFINIDEISDINYLNTSEVTNMAYMFHGCWGLASVDVSHFNTAKVTDMMAMFMECSNLTSLDLSSFNTENVTNMANMFNMSYKIESLDVSNFNTAKVTNMSGMFLDCNSLLNLDVSHFYTAKVTDMSWMFSGCTELTSLDLSNFNTTKVTDMNNMFSQDGEMITIYVDEGWTTAAVTNSAEMFYYCTKLVGGKGTTYDANHIDKAYAHIDGGPSDPGYLTNINATAEPEAYAVYTAGNTTLTFYYDDQRSTREGTTYDLNVGMDDPGWDIDGNYTSVTHVVFDPSFADARPVSTCSWFWGMTNLQSITGMDCMNTEDVTTMWGMFSSCSSLTTLDLSSFNTSKVINMLGMFSECSNLTTIYAGAGWSMATVSVNSNMFTNCTKLVGGKGTTYDPNHTNGYYARIDGGPSNPGYFTEKQDFLLGDVNGDHNVSIGDVTALIDYLLSGDGTGINLSAADCTHDNNVSIGDVTALIDYLLSGSW